MISIIVSVYNEEKVLYQFWDELKKQLLAIGMPFEVIFVNDGSVDNSQDILRRLAENEKKIKVIRFSKNFGHEAAMTAGISKAKGKAVLCMDADLQHPPSCLKYMIKKFDEGYEIITMMRTENEDETFFKKKMIKLFYSMLNLLSTVSFETNASDFFLISKRVADLLTNDFRERTRFLRGFIQVVGFKKTSLQFTAPKRVAGESKYSFFELFSNAIMAIATFSNLPLRIGVFFGSIVAIISVNVGIYSIVMKMMGFAIPGYTTIVVLISFLFAIQFFITGIIGEYIGFLFNESKKRPVYIIEDTINFNDK